MHLKTHLSCKESLFHIFIFTMEYFTHLPNFQVIICKECQYAVLPSYIDAHFTAKPQHGFGKKERQRIADEIAEIDGLIGNEETLRRCEFPFPPTYIQANCSISQTKEG
jgi:Orsellinic acid/F9775 biosynthesis cluster protein D